MKDRVSEQRLRDFASERFANFRAKFLLSEQHSIVQELLDARARIAELESYRRTPSEFAATINRLEQETLNAAAEANELQVERDETIAAHAKLIAAVRAYLEADARVEEYRDGDLDSLDGKGRLFFAGQHKRKMCEELRAALPQPTAEEIRAWGTKFEASAEDGNAFATRVTRCIVALAPTSSHVDATGVTLHYERGELHANIEIGFDGEDILGLPTGRGGGAAYTVDLTTPEKVEAVIASVKKHLGTHDGRS